MGDSKLFREGEREEILPFSVLPVKGIVVKELEEVLPETDKQEYITGKAIIDETMLSFINELEPTGAGNQSQEDSDGHTFVSVDYNKPEGEVTSGFDTEGVRASQSDDNDIPLVLTQEKDFRGVTGHSEPPTGIPDDNVTPPEDTPEEPPEDTPRDVPEGIPEDVLEDIHKPYSQLDFWWGIDTLEALLRE